MISKDGAARRNIMVEFEQKNNNKLEITIMREKIIVIIHFCPRTII